MDNELSDGIVLAIELIVISVVIGMILLFAGIGQQFERSAVASISDVVASAYGSEITALAENGDPVPVATVYLVIERNEGLVQSVTGTIQGTPITGKESLKSFFSKKVTVTVTETPQKTYIISVGG